ncbi:hypothetical protein ACFFX0_23175 [Citricoccus parietis]|uniref:Uncharacterized protein n=1 Tax=Citricoccus parietis TaxID=592307 RepID=A0ABV5G4S4_9MICC
MDPAIASAGHRGVPQPEHRPEAGSRVDAQQRPRARAEVRGRGSQDVPGERPLGPFAALARFGEAAPGEARERDQDRGPLFQPRRRLVPSDAQLRSPMWTDRPGQIEPDGRIGRVAVAAPPVEFQSAFRRTRQDRPLVGRNLVTVRAVRVLLQQRAVTEVHVPRLPGGTESPRPPEMGVIHERPDRLVQVQRDGGVHHMRGPVRRRAAVHHRSGHHVSR